jgi:hypothetical protein
VAQMAKKYGDNKLSKMCKMIAGDGCAIMLSEFVAYFQDRS